MLHNTHESRVPTNRFQVKMREPHRLYSIYLVHCDGACVIASAMVTLTLELYRFPTRNQFPLLLKEVQKLCRWSSIFTQHFEAEYKQDEAFLGGKRAYSRLLPLRNSRRRKE